MVTQLLKIQTSKAGRGSNQKRRKNGVREKTTKVKKLLRFLRLIPKRKENRITLYCNYTGGHINLWEGWGFSTLRVLEYTIVYNDGKSNTIIYNTKNYAFFGMVPM